MEEEAIRLQRMSKEDYFYFYYPNKQTLVINALISGMDDNSVYVNRGTLDFLLSHMPITGIVNTEKENIQLVDVALVRLVSKKDFAF